MFERALSRSDVLCAHSLQLDAADGSPRVYRNGLHCAREILRTEGVRTLYRGLSSSLFGVAETALQMVLYQWLKGDAQLRAAASTGRSHLSEPHIFSLACSAKLIASAVT